MSYIGTSGAGFVSAGRDGKIYIKALGEDQAEMPLNLFKTYKFGEEYQISRVAYENGTESFKFGDETRNTLWLNQDNLFIVDEKQVENIYNKLKGLTINSFEGTALIDPRIDMGDILVIGGKPVIYQGQMNFGGRFIADIKSKISIKQRQETTVKKQSQTAIRRKLQSQIDEANGKITQLVEEQTETSSKLSQHEQTIDSIQDTVRKVDEKVDNTKEELSTQITETAEGVKSEVNKTITEAKQEAIDSANSSTDNKLKDYSTTIQMNSAITQIANEISSVVSKKVGNDEIISKINQSAETVGINANKINLKANDVLNLLAGNEINFSARNISWKSDYLTIGKDGKITINSKADNYQNAEFSILGNTYANYLYSKAIVIREKNITDGSHQAFMELLSNDASIGLSCTRGYIQMNASSGIDTDGTITSLNVVANGYIESPKISLSSIGDIIASGSNAVYFGTDSSHSGITNSLRGYNVRLYCHDGGGVYLGYSGSTAITSDEKLKDIYEIDDRYIEFFKNLKPITYIYKDRGHRNHLGFGARQVEEALTKAGLTTEEFAGVLIDKDVTISADEAGTDKDVHYDELYSLRYEEFITLNTLMIQKILEKLEGVK